MPTDVAALRRAVSLFEVKALDADQRIIEGYASTPTLDRQGDILDSRGAQFALPMPLLFNHKQDQPIGTVLEARVDDHGIRIKAQIARGVLPYIDDAWALIKAGLVRGFSVGWKPLAPPTLEKSGGMRFARWLWGETSAVTVPANAAATIDLIKSLDSAPALSGSGAAVLSFTLPAAVGRSMKVNLMHATQPIGPQIEAALATLNTKSARLQELVQKDGTDAGLEDAEQTERDTLTGEIDSLATRVKSYRALEAAQLAAARPVLAKAHEFDTRTVQPAVAAAARVEVKSTLEPGIEFARYLICRMAAVKAASNGLFVNPVELAKKHYPDNPRIQWLLQKDNVPAGTTTDDLFASPLVQAQTLPNEFIEFLRPQTIVGRIRNFRRVPFNVRVASQSSGATGYWVGEGAAKPLTRYAFGSVTLTWAKVAAIIAITDELARFSSPSAEALVRDELVAALRERMDQDFVDPAITATTARPASITNGITLITSAGATLANTTTDLAAMFNAMMAANIDITECTFIMPATVALQLSLMRDTNGVLAWPGVTINGGTWQGVPVVTSQHLLRGHTPLNNFVILVHGPSILLADDGGFTVDVSREASLEMDDQPVMASSSEAGSPSGPTGSAMVSMFQTNSIAIRAERYIRWARARGTNGVVVLDDAAWAA